MFVLLGGACRLQKVTESRRGEADCGSLHSPSLQVGKAQWPCSKRIT